VRRAALALRALLAVAATHVAAQETTIEQAIEERAHSKWTGDLDAMVQRRVIRVLTPYSRTHYFIDNGVQRGLVFDAMKAFEDELNKKYKTGNLRVHVAFLPTSRDELLPALLDGRGDIAAAGLTITPEREAQVMFSAPTFTGVNEIVVTAPGEAPLASADDLSGREVFVRRSSSYWTSLEALNARLKAAGRAPANLIPAPDVLEDEDLLEMANAGLAKTLVVDDYLAKFWQQVFPNIVLHERAALRTGASIAPAVRKTSPKLQAELNAMVPKLGARTAFGNQNLQRYLKSTKYVKSATAQEDMARFLRIANLFQTYGEKYHMDWLLMTAQGYQESRLDHAAKSAVGAIGVMQVMPATGKQLAVGDIHDLEPNIHAGVKYMRFMIDQYYAKEPMTDIDKALFAFASYNCGPGRMRQLRAEAERTGLDKNVWFGNVERVASKRIGRETVTYVSNIYKYYVAYTLAAGEMAEKRKALQTTAPTGAPTN
jgi:membrane-bound lytic murein transglycosylase MltF